MRQLRTHQSNAVTALSTALKGIINLPTGTGKTLIQSRAMVKEIINNDGTKVYVVLSPRILLSNQLMNEVRKDLSLNETEAQYLVVHSGSLDEKEDIRIFRDIEREQGFSFRETLSGTTHAVIREAYDRATKENVPLIISGTYHSARRIQSAGIPIEIVFCDEAHYIVQEQFFWIVSDPFPAHKAFYFTATLRVTPSAEGMGMNNVNMFGEILYQEKPIALINAGEMVRPRMHMVDMSHDPQRDEADGLAVARAFDEHRSLLKVGAKLLVVAKDGTDELNNLAAHPEIQLLLETRPMLNVYDISSKYQARINGQPVKRDQFLRNLKGLSDSDEAIIIHYDILAEGIDVPGITGIMSLRSLKKAKFLQTLGRATRLHGKDRERLYAEVLKADELKRFVKPYAWLIVPVYGEIGEDMREDMKEMIRELRDYNFNPAEDIVVRQARGNLVPVPIAMVTEPTRAMTGLLEFAADVVHEIESEDEADLLKVVGNSWNDLSGLRSLLS